MGYYINKNSKGVNIEINKCKGMLEDGAKEIDQPESFIEDLVCVVSNQFFDAAGYCYSENEFKVFTRNDGRSKKWFIYPHAKTTSDYETVNS